MGSSRWRCLAVLLVSVSLLFACASGAVSNDTDALAAERTRRKDPLDGLRYYTGGWNISDRHYLASAGFSAAPVFVVAALWFVSVVIVTLLYCCCRCCCCCGGGSSNDYTYSRKVFAITLALAFVATAAAAVGCAVLYDGQGKFHGSTTATLEYVVSQSGEASSTLGNFTALLETAKAAGVGGASLPQELAQKVDDVAQKVDAAADELTARTSDNSRRIRHALETIRKILVGFAAVMLALLLLGFVFSLTGLKSLVNTVVFLGWIIITATLILSGTFLVLHNVIGDTCVAMDEWVLRQPEGQGQGRTALDDILPCADTAVTNEALRRSREVNHQLVLALNTLISNVSNANNIPPQAGPPLYYNQSGPPLPLLCNPFNADLTGRSCAAGEVPAADAPQAWQRFVCRATGAPGQEVCATPGRLTPTLYGEMLRVVGISDGLRQQAPALAELASCATVRRAFRTVSGAYCPPLRRHSGRVYQALLAASVAAMLAAAAWLGHARERRRRRDSERFRVSPYRLPLEEKVLLNSPRRPYKRVL
ncbi:hypothetical protein QOZ80_6AG0546330 [Eleusine coracana subsp. coracana]|nr:hypothetical protein QOZ80_6AG0546330 [Eleusine coracana subsp. coracana]